MNTGTFVVSSRRTIAAAIAAAAFAASGGVANAAITGNSHAHGLDVDVQAVVGVLGISVGPLPSASGTAPNIYNNTQTTLSATASALGVAGLNTGVLSAQATSNLTNASTTGQTHGNSSVDGLSLVVVPGILLVPDLINLTADTISSSATASFNGTNVVTSGGFLIEDLDLLVANIGVITVDANAAPNTVLLNALGIRIVVNEQIVTTVGDTTSIEVNAIHITINSPLQVVTADIVIAHSFAAITVPAPASAGVMAAAGLVAMRRRRTSNTL